VTLTPLLRTPLLLLLPGILFVLFIGWIKFPHHLDNGGLVPNKGVAAPTLSQTAGALSFHWQPHVGTLVGGFITFLYLVRPLDIHCLNFTIEQYKSLPTTDLASCSLPHMHPVVIRGHYRASDLPDDHP